MTTQPAPGRAGLTGAVVRRLAPADRQAVLQVAADTGFFGQPVEAVHDDRALFCDLLYRYYVDVDRSHGWVAEEEGGVIGFVVGAVNTRAMHARWARAVLPGIVWRALTGRYRIRRATLRRLAAQVLAALRGEAAPVDTSAYPAHLHLNVAARQRGRGVGRRLLETFLAALRAEGVGGVHLRTTDQNAAACHLFESLGFRLLDERCAREWDGLMPGPVHHRVYALTLLPTQASSDASMQTR